eukprot:TRINITY_DN65374_c0_g2_i2.p1 TRINITY_DN65374_c0_g2~~TRINITY_DN65374_c0_g2_i2.p1  ORF type:complete len:189 (-),score=10.61 TRINITY_DN65374_c0_g2_i2:183-749(-)
MNSDMESDLILELDVGGTEIHTFQRKTIAGCGSRNTAERNPGDNMLSAWLGGDSGWEMDREEDGLILIDRDGPTFQHGILDWLRDGTNHLIFKGTNWLSLPHCCSDWVSMLHQEAAYFALTDLQHRCEQWAELTVLIDARIALMERAGACTRGPTITRHGNPTCTSGLRCVGQTEKYVYPHSWQGGRH